jgi:hypothetical protein
VMWHYHYFDAHIAHSASRPIEVASTRLDAPLTRRKRKTLPTQGFPFCNDKAGVRLFAGLVVPLRGFEFLDVLG